MQSCCKFVRVSHSPSPSSDAAALFTSCVIFILAARLVLLLFSDCWLTMSSIPQGAFAATKVRQNMLGDYKELKEEKSKPVFYPPVNKKLVEFSPLKYNHKMMNSIWGQYNRYSVHNLKKNTDGKESLIWAEQQLATATPPAFHVPGFTPNFFN